jgi:hypothetical protein
MHPHTHTLTHPPTLTHTHTHGPDRGGGLYSIRYRDTKDHIETGNTHTHTHSTHTLTHTHTLIHAHFTHFPKLENESLLMVLAGERG